MSPLSQRQHGTGGPRDTETARLEAGTGCVFDSNAQFVETVRFGPTVTRSHPATPRPYH
jgi:hypothetical protein